MFRIPEIGQTVKLDRDVVQKPSCGRLPVSNGVFPGGRELCFRNLRMGEKQFYGILTKRIRVISFLSESEPGSSSQLPMLTGNVRHD
jgi:hypothetical protein